MNDIKNEGVPFSELSLERKIIEITGMALNQILLCWIPELTDHKYDSVKAMMIHKALVEQIMYEIKQSNTKLN